MSEPANARPAFRLHLVEVFQALQVSSTVRSSGLGCLLADWVGDSEVIDAGDLKGLGALLGPGEAGEASQH